MKHFLLIFIALLVICPLCQAEIRLELISQIESSNNAKAFNKRSGAKGLFQITPICLEHYNSVHRSKISLDDLWRPEVNKKVASWYLNWLGRHLKTDEQVLVAYNWGYKHALRWDGNIRSLNIETRNYLLKYRALTEAKI